MTEDPMKSDGHCYWCADLVGSLRSMVASERERYEKFAKWSQEEMQRLAGLVDDLDVRNARLLSEVRALNRFKRQADGFIARANARAEAAATEMQVQNRSAIMHSDIVDSLRKLLDVKPGQTVYECVMWNVMQLKKSRAIIRKLRAELREKG